MKDGDLVEIRNVPGIYRVAAHCDDGTVLLKGFDEDGKAVASLDPCGSIVCNSKDLMVYRPTQTETLL